MARQLLLYLPDEPSTAPAEATVSWLLREGPHEEPRLFQGALSEAAAAAQGARVTVLVAGEHVLLAEAVLPGRNRQHLVRAAPYALEEQVVDDVENLHFAIGPRGADNRYVVAVVSRARMDRWVGVLRDAGIRADVMLPDMLALPVESDAWTVAEEAPRLLVRTGAASGFVVDAASAAPLFGGALADAAEAAPARLRIHDCRTAGVDWSFLPEGVAVEHAGCNGGLLALVASSGAPELRLNLLQGEYSTRERVGRRLRPWYPAAALLALLVLVQIVRGTVDYVSLKHRDAALQTQIEAVFRGAFPEVRRIVNPRAQMQHRLDELRHLVGAGGGGAFEMLAVAGPVLHASQGLQLQSLRYKVGQMDLELQLKDLQALDDLKQRLEKATSWKIEIQSASARADGVDARLLIRSSGS